VIRGSGKLAMNPDLITPASYDYPLVALSIFISIRAMSLSVGEFLGEMEG
jgi:hypothetical protein